MAGFFKRLGASRRLDTAISQTVESRDTGPLLSFLRDDPGCLDWVVGVGAGIAAARPEGAQWVALALIDHECDKATNVLRALADCKSADWSTLGPDLQQTILDHLLSHGETDLCLHFAEIFHEDGAAPAIGLLSRQQFTAWLDGMIAHRRIAGIRGILVGYLNRVAFDAASTPEIEHGVAHAHFAAMQLWRNDREGEALEILRLLIALDPHLEPEALQAIASMLPKLIPDESDLKKVDLGDSELTEHLSRRQRSMMHVPSSVVRSADILRAFPSDKWTDYIKEAWIRASRPIRESCLESDGRNVPADLLAAGNALVSALGACAARSDQPIAIESQDKEYQAVSRRYSESIDKRNDLVQAHNSFIDEYRKHHADYNRRMRLEAQIRQSSAQIGQLDAFIERLRFETEDLETPASHLLSALTNAREYPDGVRQGAAWGLHKILLRDDLDDGVREKISETLQHTVFEAEPEDDEESDDADTRALLFSRSVGSGFAERVVCVPDDASLLEIRESIRDGLRWTADLIAREVDPGLHERLDKGLDCTIALMRDQLPLVRGFLAHYPLRLMDLGYHRQLLGKYMHSRCGLIYWTRYTPPIWKPGMRPEDAGMVHGRYLTVDDRSAPMAMGIYYRLFEHPVLALPVIYHEFLHYGGPSGNPREGITNETAVWLREILYMQYLISELAPDDADELRDYEQGIADAIMRLGLPSFWMQVFFDATDPHSREMLCDILEDTYGRQLDEATAAARTEEAVRNENVMVDLLNATDNDKLNWHPEIEWPHLANTTTNPLGRQYRQIRLREMMTRHRLDDGEMRSLIAEDVCQANLEAWHDYCRRSKDSECVLQGARPSERTLAPEAIVSIVRRYDTSLE